MADGVFACVCVFLSFSEIAHEPLDTVINGWTFTADLLWVNLIQGSCESQQTLKTTITAISQSIL